LYRRKEFEGRVSHVLPLEVLLGIFKNAVIDPLHGIRAMSGF
jgi:hypothetical protein